MVAIPPILQLDKIEQIIHDTIVNEMKSSGFASGVPEEFINHIKVRKLSDSHYQVYNDWESEDGKPLALWFEHGTKRHWVESKTKGKPLAWPSGGSESGSGKAIYSKRADNKKGKMLFSMGHYVNGIPAYESMSFGFDRGIKRMKEVLKNG